MPTHRYRGSLACALAMCAQRASAFISAPYVTPAHPTTHDPISVNVFRGECDVLSIGIVPPAVEGHDSYVTVLFTGIHEGDPEWCIYSTGTESVAIGTFRPGSYTLDVERRYMTVFGTWHQETLGVIPFTVSAAPSLQPTEAPTLSIVGLGVLAVALLVTMLRDLHRRLA